MSPCSVTEPPHAAVELAMDLIRCPSVAPVDGGAQLYLRERFSKNGFDVLHVNHLLPLTHILDLLWQHDGSALIALI